MKRNDSWKIIFFIVIVATLLCHFPVAETSALRTSAKGDPVNDYELKLIGEDTPKMLSELTGEKGILIIFWATWSDRSKSLLAFAEKTLKNQYAKLGITVLGVNVEGETLTEAELGKINVVIEEIGLSFPIAIDRGLVIFDEIGVITNPTTVLVGKDLIIEGAFPGFPSIAKDEIPAMINAYLGIEEEKPPLRVRYLLDHKPKNKALLRYNLGKNLYKRYLSIKGELARVPPGVIKQLDTAIERDPDFYAPYLLKAIIYQKTGDEEKRNAILSLIEEKTFKEQIERVDLAYMYLIVGKGDRAEELLTSLEEEIPGDPEVKLLEATLLLSGDREGDGRGILEELVMVEKRRKTLHFDITSFIDEETEKLSEDPKSTSISLAEKALNISKR